jgi:cytoskeleton protein RodZ
MGVEAGGLGARLRAGREKMGLTVLQVAERIHTDPKIVEAIEAESYEALGAPVYARGHIRHYAELVGESATELIGLYSNLSKVAQPDLTQIVKAPAGVDSSKLVAPALVMIGVFAVAGAVWWVSALSKKKPQLAETHVVGEESSTPEPGSESGPGAGAGSTEVAPQAGGQGMSAGAGSGRAGSTSAGTAGTGPGRSGSSASAGSATGSGTSGRSAAATNSTASAQSRGAPTVGAQAGATAPGRGGAAGAGSASTPSTQSRGRAEPPASQPPTRVASTSTAGSSAPSSSASSEAAQPAAPPPRSKNQAQVTLRYSADSWTEVYDAAGARLFYDVGAANSMQTVVGTPPLRVVLGNASGVAVEFNGHQMPIAKLAHPDGSVQFSINRSGRVIRAKPVADGG